MSEMREQPYPFGRRFDERVTNFNVVNAKNRMKYTHLFSMAFLLLKVSTQTDSECHNAKADSR